MAQAKAGNTASENVGRRLRLRRALAGATTWSDLDERAGVLDLGRAKLSLYLIHPDSNGTSTAWWATEDGNWLMNVVVGLA